MIFVKVFYQPVLPKVCLLRIGRKHRHFGQFWALGRHRPGCVRMAAWVDWGYFNEPNGRGFASSTHVGQLQHGAISRQHLTPQLAMLGSGQPWIASQESLRGGARFVDDVLIAL